MLNEHSTFNVFTVEGGEKCMDPQLHHVDILHKTPSESSWLTSVSTYPKEYSNKQLVKTALVEK